MVPYFELLDNQPLREGRYNSQPGGSVAMISQVWTDVLSWQHRAVLSGFTAQLVLSALKCTSADPARVTRVYPPPPATVRKPPHPTLLSVQAVHLPGAPINTNLRYDLMQDVQVSPEVYRQCDSVHFTHDTHGHELILCRLWYIHTWGLLSLAPAAQQVCDTAPM